MTIIHVCSMVQARVSTKVNGRVYNFEFHEMLGPTWIGVNGEPWKRPPRIDGPIWAAFEAWQATSKWARTEADKDMDQPHRGHDE